MLEVDIRSREFRAADGSRLLAVKDLQFTVDTNSFTCIVGPSGCGKTSTLRMILGLDKHFDGTVAIHKGKDGSGRVAAVFQEPRLLPWRSVEDNVRLAMPDELRDQPLDTLFDELGISHVRSYFPGELSLGLARRAALARAYALQPELLILDEPFVSLDDATADRLRELLIRLTESRPTTTLMVTHNVAEAAALADRILLLSPRPASVIENLEITLPRSARTPDAIHQTVAYVRDRTAQG